MNKGKIKVKFTSRKAKIKYWIMKHILRFDIFELIFGKDFWDYVEEENEPPA